MEIIKIKVKTGRPKTRITKKEGDTYFMDVKARPEKGKANLEIIRYFSKIKKKKVDIIKGKISKEKLLKVLPKV